MLHKSVKIDRIKYPTTTFAVPLIHIIRETILLQYLLINHIDGKNFAEANLWSLACTNTCEISNLLTPLNDTTACYKFSTVRSQNLNQFFFCFSAYHIF
jgi:hypothetical protein